jgi:hypothetical protein
VRHRPARLVDDRSQAPEFRKMNRTPATSTYWSVRGMPSDLLIQTPSVRDLVPRARLYAIQAETSGMFDFPPGPFVWLPGVMTHRAGLMCGWVRYLS